MHSAQKKVPTNTNKGPGIMTDILGPLKGEFLMKRRGRGQSANIIL